MLDPRYVGEHLDEVKAQLARRGFRDTATLERLAGLVSDRLAAIGELESSQQERNEAAKAMAQIADKKSDEFAEKRESLKGLKERIKELEDRHRQVEAELEEVVLGLPNLPDASTPDGADETANVVVREWGTKPSFDFEPKDHVALGEGVGVLDFERATKITGSRFVVLKGLAARLERGLMQLMLDLHADDHGYEEVWCPALVNAESLRGTGQLPKFADDLFHIEKHTELEAQGGGGNDLYLVPTAEVPVTNLHRDEILEDLPKAYCAYTPCFRSEAGSYGKDTRGMIRQHQFDKVELVRIVRPEDALAEHAALTEHAEKVLQKLGLHYRVVELCAGDLGFGAKKCFDIEVWLPSQGTYREISSCSWFGDFQARRMSTRYRVDPTAKKSKTALVHTINGSGLAIGRTLVAVLEQYQRADGSVAIPEALQAYVGGATELRP
ncbi:MAG: serine--tRNA ligase [Sandaracinus sp.]|nr:serine--tRNA ligase [Sandaracinus sp.]